MTNEKITFRRGRKRDADLAARFILSADPNFFECCYKDDPDAGHQFLRTLWRTRSVGYSHQNGLWARYDHQLAGLAIGWPTKKDDSFGAKFERVGSRVLPSPIKEHLLEIDRYIYAAYFRYTPNSYHFNILAVADEYRGQGVGKALFEHIIIKCQTAGYAAAHFNTTPDNERIISLAQQFGFEIIAEVRIPHLEKKFGLKPTIRLSLFF